VLMAGLRVGRIEQKFDVINMSLSTDQCAKFSEFLHELADEAYSAAA